MKVYLIFYNAASAAGWAYVLYLALQCYLADMVRGRVKDLFCILYLKNTQQKTYISVTI